MSAQQAAKVLDLLEFYARLQRPASLAEVSQMLGWPRSSTFSLLQTLATRGFLFQPVAREGYYPSPRWLALAQSVSDAEPLPNAIHALMDDVAEQTQETVAIGGPSGVNAIFLAVRESPAAIRYFATVGQLLPIHATSVGRSILEQYTQAERMKLYRGMTFQRFGPATPVSIDAVEAEIAAAVKRGWHENQGQFSADLVGVSMPLPIGRRRLAITVAGPSFRMSHVTATVAGAIRSGIQRCAAEMVNPAR